MKLIKCILIACVSFTSSVYALGPDLNVGIESFYPPFVMQGSQKEIYGFDVDMMNNLCKIMQRTCKYHIMRFSLLIDALINQKIDAAVSAITITPQRSKIVNLSLPYLLSYSRFLTKNTQKTQTFSLFVLNGKRIGVENGTVFPDQIKEMGVINPKIVSYADVGSELTGLSNGDVDMILIDSPTALYWASNSSESFSLLGPPFVYGYGLGIALSPGEPNLLPEINKALLQYQNSAEFRLNYNRYLSEF